MNEEDEDRFESAESLLARKFEYALQLKNAIRRLHGCESEYAGREEVMETFQDETVWNGYVEIFNISGHQQATRCHAWSWAGEAHKGEPFMVVLELPPVDSPEAAVKAAIMQEIRSAREERKRRDALNSQTISTDDPTEESES